MLNNILLVGLGGGVGSVARYLCHRWVTTIYPHPFPWGTFAVNIIGCFIIGILWGVNFGSFQKMQTWRLLLMTGFCGGFTTFSAFTLEGIQLIKDGRIILFVTYITGSVLFGLLATFAGLKLSN